jgi:hypothetical protein
MKSVSYDEQNRIVSGMVSSDGGVVYLNYNGDYIDYPPDSVNNDVSSNEIRSYLPNRSKNEIRSYFYRRQFIKQ